MRRLMGGCIVCLAVALPSRAQEPSTENAFVHHLRAGTEEADHGNLSGAMADIRAAIALDVNAAAAWDELGSLLGQMGDFPNAEDAFRRAIQLKPDLAKAHYGLALTLIGNPQGKLDWQGAVAECREALKYQPDYPEALNLLGVGLTNLAQPDAAIPVLQRAVQLSPAFAEAHFHLALALGDKGRFDEAASEYRVAIAARGTYPEASDEFAKLLLRMEEIPEAEQQVRTALRLNPDLADAHYTLARILHALGQKNDTGLEFAEAKDLDERQPNGIQASQMSNQGLSLAARGDLGGAASLLQKAIVLKPDYGVTHYNLGLILADERDTDGALQELTKAISLLPGQAKPWFDLGRVLEQSKDDRRALQAIAWAAHLSPSDLAIRSELASLRTLLHDPEIPREQPKVGAASDTASDHLAFGTVLKARGDYEGAVGELLRSLALQPGDADARRALASAYLRLGDDHHALLEYNKVVECVPEDAESHLVLGRILLRQGDAEQAAHQLRIALKYRPDSMEARGALEQAEKSPVTR